MYQYFLRVPLMPILAIYLRKHNSLFIGVGKDPDGGTRIPTGHTRSFQCEVWGIFHQYIPKKHTIRMFLFVKPYEKKLVIF